LAFLRVQYCYYYRFIHFVSQNYQTAIKLTHVIIRRVFSSEQFAFMNVVYTLLFQKLRV